VALPESEANLVPPNPADGNQLIKITHSVQVGDQGRFEATHLIPPSALRELAAAQPLGALAAALREEAARSSTREEAAPSGGGVSMSMGESAAARPGPAAVSPVQFQPFEAQPVPQGGTNLDLLLDVTLRVSVELGRSELTLRDVLALGPGSIVELDRLAGESVDILVNNRLIARGEVVVVDENYGVRVTEILSPARRLEHLRAAS